MKKIILSTMILLAFLIGANARAEQVTVPLSNPGQPVVVEIHLTHGSITAEAYDGAEVLVDVTPRETSLAKVEDDRGREGLRRLPNTGMGFSVEEEDNVVQVVSQSWRRALDVVLKVPAEASLRLQSVNQGGIKIRGVRGNHELSNTNGLIEALDVSGSVVANTTNGDVTVTMREVTSGKAMAFASLNGDVDVTLPAGIAADLKLRSDNGDILTDFDIELTPVTPRVERDSEGGRFRYSMETQTEGKINGGGPEMSLRTFNGDVILRKAQ